MRKLKPLAAVLLIAVAVVAFGFAGQHALSEGLGGSSKGSCSISGRCGSAKTSAWATAAARGNCGEVSAFNEADLTTREGRRQQVSAEYAALTSAGVVPASEHHGGCGPFMAATVAKAEKSGCGPAVSAERSACGAPAALTGVHTALADIKSGKCPLASGQYGPEVTAAVLAAVYAVAHEEQTLTLSACGVAAECGKEAVCPVVMAKHGQTGDKAVRAAVEAVRAINWQECPHLAVAAILPASCAKTECAEEACAAKVAAGCAVDCGPGACEVATTASLTQQARAEGSSPTE